MGIRLTESRIPAGFRPQDLGEAVEVADGTRQLKYALVSYLTSPIVRGSNIDYVVFVLGEDLANAVEFEYRWTLTYPSSGNMDQKITSEGVYRYSADRTGWFIVRVEVLRGSAVVADLSLTQRVVEPELGLEALLAPTGMLKHLNVDASIGALGGNPRASRELINNFRRYVLDATDPPVPYVGIDVPARFLAAIVYAEILRVGEGGALGRDAEVEAAAAELNGDWSLARAISGMQNALGVSQIRPQTLAMVLERSPGISCTQWTELPSDLDKRPAVAKRILANLDGQPDAEIVKVDLFNLLRFPKSNIRMCAQLLRTLATRSHRWPNATRVQLMQNESALGIIATEYKIGGTESSLAPEQGPPAPMDAKANAYGRRIVQNQMRLPAIVLYFADSTSKGASAYGGYALRRKDNDGKHRWGGSVVAESLPAGEVQHVKVLQRDLADLGFKIVGIPDGGFGRRTEWAVREFQIYANMPNIAVETDTGAQYVDRLMQMPNVLPYAGPVSGVVNAATRVALQYWKASKWRCPVVIAAYHHTDGSLFNSLDNIWLHDEVADCSPDVYVRDFSEYYDLDQHSDLQIGMHAAVGDGPVSLQMNTCGHMRRHPMVEVTPELLAGIPTSDLSESHFAAQRSTYKVVRSIAQAESVGYFDSVNAWDSAIISIGMYHWTLGLRRTGASVARGETCLDSMCDGEMCAFLGLLKMMYPDDYEWYFRRFGIDVDRNWWVDGIHPSDSGAPFYINSLCKYAGWLRQESDDGAFADLPRQVTEANYVRNWHWFYRVTMANRQSEAVHKLNWAFTRIRIRDLLRLPWRREDVPLVVPGADFRLSDIYTSEKAVAILLRGHVNYPRKICFDGCVSNSPSEQSWQANFNVIPRAFQRAVVAHADLNWSASPENWGDEEETALVAHLLTMLKSNYHPEHVSPTFDIVASYTWNGEALSEKRDSFLFYGDDLPDAPSYE